MPAPASNLYLFAGGGTGGHLTPGFAVARALARRELDARVLFAGSERPLEREMVAAQGFEHEVLPVEPLPTIRRAPWRFFWRTPWRFFWRNYGAWRKANSLLDRLQPRAVIGLGGFASVPLVWGAVRRKIPTLILEQNVIAGRSTRWLASRVDRVCLAFAETRNQLSPHAQVSVTGNPVRDSIAALTINAQKSTNQVTAPPQVLILGGSQGAAGLNAAVLGMIATWPVRWRSVHVIHQSGREQATEVRAAYARSGLSHQVEPFFQDLSAMYAAATLVVSRAGATTLAELACAGCPTILVPFPQAADDHQSANAAWYTAAKAAMTIHQSTDSQKTAEQLGQAVVGLLDDPAQLAAMGRAMQTKARPDAADQVVATLQSLLSGAMT